MLISVEYNKKYRFSPFSSGLLVIFGQVPFSKPLRNHRWVSKLQSYFAVLEVCVHAKSLQSCLTLCDPIDCSLPGSSVHGFSRQEYWSGLPGPLRDRTLVFYIYLHWQMASLLLTPPRKPSGHLVRYNFKFQPHIHFKDSSPSLGLFHMQWKISRE